MKVKLTYVLAPIFDSERRTEEMTPSVLTNKLTLIEYITSSTLQLILLSFKHTLELRPSSTVQSSREM